MDSSILVRAAVMWLLFIPVPVINGILREKWYRTRLGDDAAAHQLGTLVVAIFFLLYVYIAFGSRLKTLDNVELLTLGGVWLGLTVVFEFSLGLAGGRSWPYMLDDYNLGKGRVWPLLLIVIFLSPFLVRWMV